MTAFDHIFLIVMGLSILIGLMRGAVRELFSMTGWFLAFYCANIWHTQVLTYLSPHISNETIQVIVAFIGIFLLVLLTASLLSLAITSLFKAVGLGGVNRLFGGLVGALRGLLLSATLMLLAGMTSLPKDPRWTNAMFSAPLEALVLQCLPYLPDSITQKVHLGKPDSLIAV